LKSGSAANIIRGGGGEELSEPSSEYSPPSVPCRLEPSRKGKKKKKQKKNHNERALLGPRAATCVSWGKKKREKERGREKEKKELGPTVPRNQKCGKPLLMSPSALLGPTFGDSAETRGRRGEGNAMFPTSRSSKHRSRSRREGKKGGFVVSSPGDKDPPFFSTLQDEVPANDEREGGGEKESRCHDHALTSSTGISSHFTKKKKRGEGEKKKESTTHYLFISFENGADQS